MFFSSAELSCCSLCLCSEVIICSSAILVYLWSLMLSSSSLWYFAIFLICIILDLLIFFAFSQGDVLQVKVNKLSSTKTQLPYDYYFLKYCKPRKIMNNAENLGEVLRGDRIENSVYTVSPFLPTPRIHTIVHLIKLVFLISLISFFNFFDDWSKS